MFMLRDGRRLAYSVAGPEDGFPVLYFHGAIGTAVAIGAAVEALGLRYVCVNRPGFGASELAPGRTLLGFARDVEQLADALAFERFAVVGVSAGGPYALACGCLLGERVSSIGVVSSLSPLCAPHAVPGMPKHISLALRALAGRPEACAWLGERGVSLVRRHPWLLARAMTAGAPSCDRRMLEGREARGAAAAQFLALALAANLPRCRAYMDPEEGHFLFRRRLPEVLGAVTGSPRAVASPPRSP